MSEVLPSIVATNLKLINKNTLVVTVDLTVTKWRFTFRDCLWHRKGNDEWVAFPAKEWTDRDAKRKFANLCEFINHGDARRFNLCRRQGASEPDAISPPGSG
jgi:hypothetical protein